MHHITIVHFTLYSKYTLYRYTHTVICTFVLLIYHTGNVHLCIFNQNMTKHFDLDLVHDQCDTSTSHSDGTDVFIDLKPYFYTYTDTLLRWFWASFRLLQVIRCCVVLFGLIVLRNAQIANIKNDTRNVPKPLRNTVIQFIQIKQNPVLAAMLVFSIFFNFYIFLSDEEDTNLINFWLFLIFSV